MYYFAPSREEIEKAIKAEETVELMRSTPGEPLRIQPLYIAEINGENEEIISVCFAAVLTKANTLSHFKRLEWNERKREINPHAEHLRARKMEQHDPELIPYLNLVKLSRKPTRAAA